MRGVERLTAQRRRASGSRLGSGGEIGDVLQEIAGALFDQPAGALLLPHAKGFGRGVVDDGGSRLAGIVDRAGAVAAAPYSCDSAFRFLATLG